MGEYHYAPALANLPNGISHPSTLLASVASIPATVRSSKPAGRYFHRSPGFVAGIVAVASFGL